MSHYAPGFTEDDYDELKSIILQVAADGSFDANDVTVAYLNNRPITPEGVPLTASGNIITAGSVVQMLHDLVDLGHLRLLGGDPPRWEVA